MKTSDKGIDLIKSHEGLRLEAYKCPADVWTIGYGHTKEVKPGDKISASTATQYLKEDLSGAEKTVNGQKLNINQHQFDALVSFVFNVGSGNFLKSTLLKKAKINANDPSIRQEFSKWVNGGGKKLPGLVRRRTDEANLYFL